MAAGAPFIPAFSRLEQSRRFPAGMGGGRMETREVVLFRNHGRCGRSRVPYEISKPPWPRGCPIHSGVFQAGTVAPVPRRNGWGTDGNPRGSPLPQSVFARHAPLRQVSYLDRALRNQQTSMATQAWTVAAGLVPRPCPTKLANLHGHASVDHGTRHITREHDIIMPPHGPASWPMSPAAGAARISGLGRRRCNFVRCSARW